MRSFYVRLDNGKVVTRILKVLVRIQTGTLTTQSEGIFAFRPVPSGKYLDCTSISPRRVSIKSFPIILPSLPFNPGTDDRKVTHRKHIPCDCEADIETGSRREGQVQY
jgi:hypothetical protein